MMQKPQLKPVKKAKKKIRSMDDLRAAAKNMTQEMPDDEAGEDAMEESLEEAKKPKPVLNKKA